MSDRSRQKHTVINSRSANLGWLFGSRIKFGRTQTQRFLPLPHQAGGPRHPTIEGIIGPERSRHGSRFGRRGVWSQALSSRGTRPTIGQVRPRVLTFSRSYFHTFSLSHLLPPLRTSQTTRTSHEVNLPPRRSSPHPMSAAFCRAFCSPLTDAVYRRGSTTIVPGVTM